MGERYILSGRNFTFDRLFADLGRLSGIDPPLRLPAAAGAPGGRAARRRRPRLAATPAEVQAAGQWWTYRSTKARRELGWAARPHEETLEATVAWHLEREHDRIARTRSSRRCSRGWPGPRSARRELAGAVLAQDALPRP